MTQVAYCWDEDGYFSHEEECTIDPLESAKAENPIYVLPSQGCLERPEVVPGKVARRIDGKWVQEVSHKGKTGYVKRMPHTIDKYGPLPEGFTETLPPLTEAEQMERLRMIRDGKLFDTDKYLISDYPVSSDTREAIKAYRQALRDLPAQMDAPWDGGGELTPWPVFPLEDDSYDIL